ncbi:hypothetical protein BFG07_00895 [Kosakonia cowanii]|nr:hypothetical protein BFG07_00895 [Kosakonia cowanii]
MLGVNTFYDDDYTGHNQRIGLGGEAWTDYLKFAINGYKRQTSWHQSPLHAMEDYDERPANGFDLRANAWLPSLPNVGGSLEFDKYFGKGVSLSDSTSPDSLKNNPQIFKMGVNYTPFPLLTLSAKRSIGDSHDTELQLDFNYRFGVPIWQQIRSDSVSLMRSLTGSRYDLVDRNYDIVMQYRKQDLIHIHLPDTTQAEAAETVNLELRVDHAKYGLKDVAWKVDPALLSNGGHYKELSPTELKVTLPAYISKNENMATTAQIYSISAVATDNHGNESNTAETHISVIPSKNTISSLIISPSDKALPANNTDNFIITGKVTDRNGAPLPGQNITFSVKGLINKNGEPAGTLSSADGGQNNTTKIALKSASDGTVVARLRSYVAGKGIVTARMDNGNQTSVNGIFVADSTTASVREVTLQDNVTSKVADGKSSFLYTALVEDANGNPVPGTDVFWSHDVENVIFSADKTTTDSNGYTNVRLRSKTIPATNILVSAALSNALRVNANKKVNFTADTATAQITNIAITDNNKPANGQATDALILTVKDANGNLVPNATVNLSADHGAKIVNSVITNAEGQATATLTSLWAGDIDVTARINSSTKVAKAVFTADSSTAQVSTVALNGSEVSKLANGTDSFTYTVTVVDGNKNPVPGITVTPSADSKDVQVSTAAVTDASGHTTFTMTSTRAVADVTAIAKAGDKGTAVNADRKVSFTADSSTAQVSTVALNGSEVSKLANGTDSFTYTVTVVDGNKNPFRGSPSRRQRTARTCRSVPQRSPMPPGTPPSP